MTDGVIMFYYAQHTRPITELAGIKGPSKFGSRCHLAAARAVNELCDAVARLAPAAASQHYDCLTADNDLQRINDNSATIVDRDDDKPNCNRNCLLCDNYIIRSIKNYRAIKARLQKIAQDSTLPRVMRSFCACARGGFVKGGYPFMFISPFDLKLKIK